MSFSPCALTHPWVSSLFGSHLGRHVARLYSVALCLRTFSSMWETTKECGEYTCLSFYEASSALTVEGTWLRMLLRVAGSWKRLRILWREPLVERRNGPIDWGGEEMALDTGECGFPVLIENQAGGQLKYLARIIQSFEIDSC